MTGFDDIEYASLTDVGIRRSHNQDNHAILLASDDHQWQARGHVFLVADGMGAHAVGELASALAVGIIPHTYDKYASQGTASALRKAFIEANTSIHSRGQQNREFEGMGTTATALVLRPDGAWVAHVGDSRAYRIRDGHIEQLSFDHSMVWEYARRQHMDPETVQGIPSNVIFRSLGPEPLVPIDIEGVHPLRDGDVFLVCSDGLSGRVSDPELGAIASVLPPKEACRFLVDLANLRGGPDNITVVIVRVGSHMATPPPAAKPWYRRFPWPLVALLLGVMLAGTAVALIIEGNMVWANLCFALAVVAIVGGLGGLAAYQARENRRLSEEAARPRPKIHRSLECRIEPPLLDRWARSDQGLVQQAREKNWEPNWAAHDELVHDAQDHLAQGDLVHAFRSFCRAMQTLMTAMQSQRGKTEVFHPVWDKHPISSQPAGQGDNGREAPSYRCEQCGKVVPPPADRSIPRCCEQPMKPM